MHLSTSKSNNSPHKLSFQDTVRAGDQKLRYDLVWPYLASADLAADTLQRYILGYTACIVCAPCLLPCFLNCTVFLCYPYWITMMWCGLHLLAVQSFRRLERIHLKFLSPSSRTDLCNPYIQQYKYIKLHHLSLPVWHLSLCCWYYRSCQPKYSPSLCT